MTNQKIRAEKQRRMSNEEKSKMDRKIKEDMKQPINQFMNAVDMEGEYLYPIAPKLRQYFLANPDPAIDAMQMANALLHEIRWHKEQARKYHEAYVIKTENIEMRDKYGKVMSREECYISWISETQVIHTVVSKLRNHLVNGLLPTVDQEIFTYQQFNDYVVGVEEELKKMGYELFPFKVDIIKPL